MKLNGYETLICNCERTMTLAGKKICKAAGGSEEPDIFNNLCRAEVGKFAEAVSGHARVLVACTQEAPLFSELAQEQAYEGELRFANIRERGGWSTDKADNSAKIAALLADATHVSEPAGSISVTSSGQCLVYGAGQQALEVARKLNTRIPTTVLLSDPGDVIPPPSADVALFKGKISKATGHLGAFEIVVDGYAPMMPSAKQSADFVMPRDGASSTCALILDLSGEASLFTGGHLRDGYKKVDAGDPAGVMEAMFELADMAGEFEKPLYVQYDASICAHSRSMKTGCTKCLDVCPAGAITSTGDRVEIDPVICGGCGSCAAVCPTGAASYAMPKRSDLVARISVLVSTYLNAGGKNPEILVHDNRFGLELIGMSARFGRGLPENVLPLGVNEITQIGHDAMLAMMAAGVARIHLIANPARSEELSGSETQIELTRAMAKGLGYRCSINLISESDPDILETAMWTDKPGTAFKAHAISGVGSKRDVARTMLGLLNQNAPAPQDVIALPDKAPYGQIIVNTETCTLCQACVGACPVNAIADNPDKPQLSFTEAACVQCGLCRTTCPEGAITLEPRYNFAASALSPTILNEEDPFACISCGKEFGTKSTIEKITRQLAGKHAMFADSDAAKLIQMCDNCRIEHQANSNNDPFAGGERPRIRRTEDYIEAERKTNAGEPLSADDFLMDDD